MPFCLLSKKRYVGMKYVLDPEICKRTEMGIVLKRRDNAPIVKDIYGGIIDILMKKQNIPEAIAFLKSIGHKDRRLIEGTEREHLLTLFALIEPVGSSNNQRAFTETYHHADKVYELTWGFSDEGPSH